jgi:hypothetical protein
MADTELLTDDSDDSDDPNDSKSDFPSMGIDLLKRVNIKIALFLFIIGIFIFSDIFSQILLPNYDDGTNTINSTGTIIQLMLLSIAYIILDLLDQGGVI